MITLFQVSMEEIKKQKKLILPNSFFVTIGQLVDILSSVTRTHINQIHLEAKNGRLLNI